MPELIGSDFAEVIHILWPSAKADEAIRQFRHTLATGEACYVPELIELRADRQTIEYYEWQINRIPLPDGSHGVVCYFRDISERVLAQQKIRASEERYHGLFNSIDEGFCVIEMIFDAHEKPVDGRYLEVNPSFVTLTGFHDSVGKRMRELVPDLEANWFEMYGKVVLTGEAIRFTNEAKGLDGRWFDLYALRLGGPDSRKVAVLFTDITERKQAEQALRKSEQEFRVLSEAMPQIVWVTRPDGWNIYFNQQWVDYTGLTMEESHGHGWNTPFHPDDQQRAWDAWRLATQHQETYSLECRLRRADGAYRWWLIRGVPQHDANGEILKWFGTCTDIEGLKQSEEQVLQLNSELEQRVQARTAELSRVNADLQAEITEKEQLRESEERLITVAENLSEGLCITSMEGEFIHWNRASLDMHGFASMAECRGQLADFTQLVEVLRLDGSALPFDQWPMSRALRGEVVRNCELRIRRTDTAMERILSYDGSLVRDSAGKQSAFLTVTDIAERLHAEAQLRELNDTLERRVLERTQALGESEMRQKRATDAAESANQSKSDFLSTMSHEIRTPLNGMLGMTELLLTERLTPQQRQYAALAHSSGKTLLALVNDLLDIGKIEAGQLDVEHIPFSLNELLSELTELYTLRAHEKSLVFSTKKAPGVPKTLLGDPGHLRQILNNLLVNALKFTPQGEIGLSVERLGGDGHSCLLRFSVHDSGIGIAADLQPRLFTRFTQADSSSTSQYGGSGLGLAIVKQLCEHLGGEVALTSTPGQGSVFSCDIPFTEVAQTVPVPVPVPVPVLSPTRILMAEDNPINQMVARAQLQSLGYANVTVVDNGQEAVNAVHQGGFDLVLMDCRMPVLDGYGATEQIRAQGYLLPIIAMTANAASAERDKCLQLGMNDYMSKPFNIATLRETLARWIP